MNGRPRSRATLKSLRLAVAAATLCAACASAPVAEPVRSPQPTVAIDVQPAGREMVVLIPDPDGSVGALTVAREGREVVLTQPYTAAAARGPRAELSGPETIDRAQFELEFAAALGALPAPPAHFILFFEKGSSGLTDASLDQLKEIVAAVGARQALDVSVIGHADATGPEDVNIKLSRQRAAAVADALVSLGVERSILEVGSHGSRVLLVPGVADDPRNRRVEVTVR